MKLQGNVDYQRRIQILSLVGLAGSAYVAITYDDHGESQARVQVALDRYLDMKKANPNDEQLPAQANEVAGLLTQYLSEATGGQSDDAGAAIVYSMTMMSLQDTFGEPVNDR